MWDICPANFSCDKDITAGTPKQQYFQTILFKNLTRDFSVVFEKYIYLHHHFIVKIYKDVFQFELFHSII